MDDLVLVHVGQRLAHLDHQAQRSLAGHGPLLLHESAQGLALDEFHDDVHAALFLGPQHAHDVGVFQTQPQFFLAPETLVKHHVTLELRVGDLQHHRRPGRAVSGLEDGRHSTARQHVGQLVLIEAFADAHLAHQNARPQELMRAILNVDRQRSKSRRAGP